MAAPDAALHLRAVEWRLAEMREEMAHLEAESNELLDLIAGYTAGDAH